MTRARRVLARAALVAGSLTIVAAAGEMALRAFGVLDLDWRMVESHPRRMEVLSPNFDGTFHGQAVHTNQFGHRVPVTRGRQYTEAKPSGVVRVAVVGDSMTFGDEWPVEVSFVEQLQARLDPSFSRVQVINFGVPGYGPTQEADYIAESVFTFQPDLIVVESTEANDFLPPAAVQPQRFASAKTFLRRHLLLYSALFDVWYHGRDSALGQLLVRPHVGDGTTTPPSDARQRVVATAASYYQPTRAAIERNDRGWRAAIDAYHAMAAMATAHRVPFAIVSLPIAWDYECRAWRCTGSPLRFGDVVAAAGARAFYDELRAQYGAVTPRLAFASDWFSALTLDALLDDRPTLHYGPRKNRIVAEHLAQLVRGWIDGDR